MLAAEAKQATPRSVEAKGAEDLVHPQPPRRRSGPAGAGMTQIGVSMHTSVNNATFNSHNTHTTHITLNVREAPRK